uniref:Putative portal protein n=1 Tax=viral metagenome TaxID=1070528 RepID=A0A6H1ZNX3_9ZZZZ
MDELKVSVDESVRTKVINWVDEQITTALKDRVELEKRWVKWVNQYEEILPNKKTFPWEGCSNISVPVVPTAVETIHAREVNTVFAVRPYIQVKPKKEGADREKCQMLEMALDYIFDSILNIYTKGSEWFLEKDKMGTAFAKVYWHFDRKKVLKKKKLNLLERITGQNEWGFKFVETDKACFDVVPIEDLVFPSNSKNISTASFVAQKIRTQLHKLEAKEQLGIYENIDRIKPHTLSTTASPDTGVDVQRTKEQAEHIIRTNENALGEYELYEVHFDYDIDGDGFPEYTVMTLHRETRTVVRWTYFPYQHGRRPFIPLNYMPRVNRIYGLGICEMSEHLQDATNTVFNQTIDNMTIANAKCFKGRKSSRKDIGKIYPGKIFWLDDPTDLVEFMMGDVHQSNFLLHSLLRDYHERRTKVNDYTTGRESSIVKSRATATGTLALLQESGRHFDLIINNTRQAIVELAYQVLELYFQYAPYKVFQVTGKDGQMMNLELPSGIESLREEYEFYATATSLAVNKEIEKQSNLILMQQLGTIFGQMIQLLQAIYMTPLPDDVKNFMMGVVRAYFTLAEDLVRSFEKIDIKSYLPELPDLVKTAFGGAGSVEQMMSMMQGMVGGQNGSVGVPTGMENVPQEPSMGSDSSQP